MTEEQATQLITLMNNQNDNTSMLAGIILFMAGLIFAVAISIIIMGWLRDT